MSLPVLLLGAGGHAKVLADMLRASGMETIGILDPQPGLAGTSILGLPILGDDQLLDRFSPGELLLANGLGSVGLPVARRELFERCVGRGYRFVTILHPSAIVAPDVQLGEGVQVMAGAVLQPGCCIGRNTIVNTRASLDHDCRIGDHVHIAPGVTCSGNVTVGDTSHIGVGATVVQGVMIGSRSVVGAASLVLRDVSSNSMVRGIPAQKVSV